MTKKDEGQDNETNSDDRRVQLEKDACEKCSHGDLLGAIKDIDGAIAVDQQWYHYLYKALWFARLQNLNMTYATLQAGLGHYQGKEFWFRYYYAEIIYNLPSPLSTIEEVKNRIKDLDNAIIAAERAYKTLEADKLNTIEKDIKEIPEYFTTSGYINLNLTNLKFMISGLLRELKLSKSGLMTADAIYATGNLVNSKIAKVEEKVESERIKTIELLGIFTAIISFVIITGTSALKMKSFEVAMPILGSLALVLLLLVSALTLFTTKYACYREMFRDLRLYVFVFLVITIGSLMCYSVNKTVKQNNSIIPKIPTKENVSMENNFFNIIMAICAIIGTGAVLIAASQLYLSTWLKAQEVFTDNNFREARGVVLSHYWQSDKVWTEEDADNKKRALVCAKMDELARLRPFIPKWIILKTWDDPMGKCWHVLQEFVIEERKKTGWDVKWKAFEKLGEKAFARVKARKSRQRNT